MATRPLTVGIVGATGLVGRELLAVLEQRRFPVKTLLCYSSGRAKKTVPFKGRNIPAPGVDPNGLRACDLVVFVSADAVSKKLAPGLAARGVWVIDDSSAFRLDPKIPLVIPEVNAHHLKKDKRLIAGPNCAMTPVAVAANRLHRELSATEVRISTYQSVAGAGSAALGEFFEQNKAQSRHIKWPGRAPVLPFNKSAVLPKPIAFNVIPQVGGFNSAGLSSEEFKIAAELRKVWDAPSLKVSATAVRVPAVRGHSMAVWLTLRKPISPAKARRLMKTTAGAALMPEGDYPTPLQAAGKGPVYIGRVRPGATAKEVCFWTVSDSLLKGAALNSVQIAEELLRRRWLA